MIFSISFQHIIDNLIPIPVGKVDIKIRRTGPVGVKKAFEIQVERDGIDVGDPKTVGNKRVGAAAPANMIEAATLCITDHVPGDEEIGGEFHLVDDAQLFIKPVLMFFAGAITLEKAFPGQLFQEYPIVFPAGGVELFVLVQAEIHRDRTCIGEPVSIGDKEGVLTEGYHQIRLWEKTLLLAGQVFRL
jgi:hypothetical protein